MRSDLRQHRVQIAFDDFGVGQPRYVQLAEAPPDYLKFDIALIHHVDRSAPSQRRMLRSLVTAAHDLGVKTIAEGVETAAEAEVCGEIGFTHAQGYFFGRPVPPGQL
jgi:EAL domain-containing protein (putative c-di-GMP-specific phosphodiesterase class I)